ncbi:MAG: metallopeptidase family protein [Candidatus Levybacteria bacterium]|nr:metallopeptidase family protein [Candidatus Levybacteria bacterium]
MTDDEFTQVVKETIKTLPLEFKSQLDNVEIVIKDVPDGEDFDEDPGADHLLGLYHGIPKTERESYSALPDKITIFKQPIFAISHNKDEITQNIKETVLHELGHHFGLSDAAMEQHNA